MLKEIELEEVHRLLKVPLTTQGYPSLPKGTAWARKVRPNFRGRRRRQRAPTDRNRNLRQTRAVYWECYSACHSATVPLGLVVLRTSRARTHARVRALLRACVWLRVRARACVFVCVGVRACRGGYALRALEAHALGPVTSGFPE